jgi:hypothetical protein
MTLADIERAAQALSEHRDAGGIPWADKMEIARENWREAVRVVIEAIVRFRVLPRLSGRAWGACFQSGIPALPFDGGQSLPPRLTRVGSFGAATPQAAGPVGRSEVPVRAKFPPEVRFFVAGNTVTVGDTSQNSCGHGRSKAYLPCNCTGCPHTHFERRGCHHRPAFIFCAHI